MQFLLYIDSIIITKTQFWCKFFLGIRQEAFLYRRIHFNV